MPDVNQIVPVALLILGLGVAWIVMRFVFKLAKRVFVLGCLGIVVLGLLLYFGVLGF